MSFHWSLWIMFLVVLNLGITLFLFLWGTRVPIPHREDGTTGHVWAHGTLREGVRPLPRWWYLMSASTFVIGIGYLVLYPGFGAYDGLLDWSSRGQLEQAQERNQALLAPLMEEARNSAPSELAGHPEAVRLGGRLFQDNCAACHGVDARGNTTVGAPDLLDDAWVYGGGEDAILTSIRQGREGVMPGWAFLGYGRVKNLAHYVRSLSGESHDPAAARAGENTSLPVRVVTGRTAAATRPWAPPISVTTPGSTVANWIRSSLRSVRGAMVRCRPGKRASTRRRSD